MYVKLAHQPLNQNKSVALKSKDHKCDDKRIHVFRPTSLAKSYFIPNKSLSACQGFICGNPVEFVRLSTEFIYSFI